MLRPFFLFIGSLLGTPAEKEPREPSLAAKIVYCGAGLTLESASLLARFGWKVSLLTPWASTYGRECLYFSQILDHAAHHALVRMLQDSTPSNTQSWRQNLELLSQVPVSSEEEQRLLHFLEKHWLAKVSGYFSWWVNWVSPCFGAFVQVHPETTGFYSRNPGINLPEAYKNRVNAWKKLLPHPYEFPLLLTRPCDIREYLPSCLEVSQGEEVGATIERLKNLKGKAALDLTNVLNTQDPKEWLLSWEDYRNRFLQTCEEGNVDAKQIICIQKILPNGIGAIRQLPLKSGSIDRDHQYLLDWISSYGLTASRIELDRWPAASALHREAVNPISLLAKEEYISSLDSIETSWRSAHPQKTLMVQGALHILKGLLASVSKDRWEEILDSPTRSALVQLSISKIQDRLSFLSQNEKRLSFF